MRYSILVLLLLVSSAAAVTEAPDRDSLLVAWEELQRTDAQTRRFERLDDGRYSFKTERFPFDGTLQVLEVVVDDRLAEGPMSGPTVGHVSVEFEGVDDEFKRRYATSMGLWHSTNVLYWDEASKDWMTSDDWTQGLQDEFAPDYWSGWISNGFWIGLLLIVALSLWWVSRRAGRQMNAAMRQQNTALSQQEEALEGQQEALELARESAQLLREIRELLAQRKD